MWTGCTKEGSFMSYVHYKRLSATDTTFLEVEEPNAHMHVGAVGIFDAEPVSKPEGGLDMERILAFSNLALLKSDRFRQKITYIPGFQHPVWIDDDRFNLMYHVRHTALPAPGSVRMLKRLAGRIMSQQLDRGKPLWELWFVEGLEGNRFSVISKFHHCVADGIAGADMLSVIMGPDPEYRPKEHPEWMPRPAPTRGKLLFDELWRRTFLPLANLGVGRKVLSEPRETVTNLRDAILGLGETAATTLWPASHTPLNYDIGPHRRFDWLRFDLDEVKEIKNRLGGTVNDVVLTCVTGALRPFLRTRNLRFENLDFRAMVPVNVRAAEERGTLGNRISSLAARLPIHEADPRTRLARVIEVTRELKSSKQTIGGEALAQLSDATFTGLLLLFARMIARGRAVNMVVTNVPGPKVPVYMLGAPLLEVYPLVPLAPIQALGVALFSYAGGLFWGFNADWDAVPDLHDFVEAISTEFLDLRKIASQAGT
jgi:WS/DGAT/MGAT family acyltransferase